MMQGVDNTSFFNGLQMAQKLAPIVHIVWYVDVIYYIAHYVIYDMLYIIYHDIQYDTRLRSKVISLVVF